MRILYVVHQFYPQSSSGTEQFLLHLASSMQRSGHHVDIVAYSFSERSEFRPCGSLFAKHYQYKGISIIGLRHDRIPIDINTSLEDSAVLSFAREVVGNRSRGYDLVHIAHPMRLASFAMAAGQAGIPYVVTLTDFWMICPKINLYTSFNTQCWGPAGGKTCLQWCPELQPEFVQSRLKATREILHGANAIVVPSRLVAGMFRKEFPELSASIIPHGLPVDRFTTNPRMHTEKIVFAYCGGLSAHKGVHVLIAAFRSLEELNVELRIYGASGRDVIDERTVRNAAGQDDRIKFCGRYQEEEIGKIFQAIDALIIPSLCYESYSFALHEALASRLPVIASAVPCLDEKISDSAAGLTFRAGDADDLASKLRLVVSDRRMLDKIKENMKRGAVSRLEEEAYLYERIYREAGTKRLDSEAN
jgi:glycosyltransferase involved in cell wall biosynthesis